MSCSRPTIARPFTYSSALLDRRS
uniref:Uncharacterized protein n=1 Tax=Anguilla anguilla TaxID=7936 RepID=A0A0E9SXW2_ANGAN